MTKPGRRIVVTGIGPIASVGIGKESFWRGILQKNTGLEVVENLILKERWEKFYLHKVKDFHIKDFGINQDDLDYIKNWKEKEDNVDLLFLLAAVKLALDDGKIDYESQENHLGLVVTHENPGLEQLLWKTYRESFQLLKNDPALGEKDFCYQLTQKIIKTAYETQTFMQLFHIARTFHVHDYSFFISNACASGLYAVELAADLIRLGKFEQMIVAAGDCPDVFKHLWFKMIKMYPSDGKTKPFAKDGGGFVMGEGAAALVLEDYDHAKKRNAHIYAEYLGGGFKLEGWGVTTPMIGGSFYKEAIETSLDAGQVQREEIDAVCAHGVGTSASDYYEAKAISDVFQGLNTPTTAFKPYIGHNLGGSTLVELAILLLGLENNLIPPVLNTREMDPKMKINLVQKEIKKELKTVLKTCSAFAGYNASLVFRKLK